jgi:hypothetical protein
MHGGSKRNNPDITRKSMVIHYFFENCDYWTPLISKVGDIIFRDPNNFVNDRFNTLSQIDDNNDNNDNDDDIDYDLDF